MSDVAQRIEAALAQMPMKGDVPDPKSRAHTINARLRRVARFRRMKTVKGFLKGVVREAVDEIPSRRMRDPALPVVVERIEGMISRKRSEMSERNIELILEALLPANDPMAAVRSKLEQDNAAARASFLQKVPCLSSEDLAEAAGHVARNRSATASRWKADGRIFAVQAKGRDLYPAFQFDDGKPKPVIARIISALPKDLGPWQLAFWFVSSNPWLGRRSPMERLSDGEAVIDAARALGEDAGG